MNYVKFKDWRTRMNYGNFTNEELVHIVDNTPTATPLDRELANRLDAAIARERKRLEQLSPEGDML